MDSGFECQSCGIRHSHNEGLDHSLSGAFSKATVALSMDLQYNPDCHCGWHELNARIQKGEIEVDSRIADFIAYRCESLLIPESVEEELYEEPQSS